MAFLDKSVCTTRTTAASCSRLPSLLTFFPLSLLHRLLAWVSYLPAFTWQLELFLALFSTLLLVLQLTHRLPPISQIHIIPYVTVPFSAVLLLDSYLALSHLESLYAAGKPSSSLIEGIPLQARRMREQRDCYLAFYTLVIGIVLWKTERMAREAARWQTQYYTVRQQLDEQQDKQGKRE